MRLFILLFCLLFLSSCTTFRSSGSRATRSNDRKLVDQELGAEQSLTADRSELANLRKEIPDEKKKSNDELALFLQLMQPGTLSPEQVHERFRVMMEKRRTSFRNKVQKLRDDYRRDEVKRRDSFLDAQKSKRNSYTSGKHTSEETRDFFSAQDRDRQSFFADERDRRGNFEGEINAQSKDFESYMREKMNEFTEQYRLYSKKYYERAKDKKPAPSGPPPAAGAAGNSGIDSVPVKELKTE